MKLHSIPTAALLAAVALAPSTLIAGSTAPHRQESGTIKSVDMAAHQLVVCDLKNKAEHTFRWNDQTQFIEHGQARTAADLKTGERIQFSCRPEGSETPTIERARLAPAQADQSPAATHRPSKDHRNTHG